MTINEMNCDRFDEALSDYLEESLNENDRAAMDRHLKECVRCAGLVRDLDRIRTEASALPDLVPSRDLWAGIESRIAAPVIPLATRERTRSRFAPWMAAAAAALVVSTAGITYLLTANSMNRPEVVRVAVTPGTQQAVTPQTTSSEPEGQPTSTGQQVDPARVGPTPAPTASSVARDVGVRTTAASVVRAVSSRGTDAVYGREIDMLQQIVTDRRAQLDSGTVAIIERNLKIIDAAIAQSKAALAKDPASQLLSDQLTRALDKKVELLRTAAMLPAST